jgi:hypothetical protein
VRRLVVELRDPAVMRGAEGFRRLLVRAHDHVTIVFADIAGFTAFSATVSPAYLVRASLRSAAWACRYVCSGGGLMRAAPHTVSMCLCYAVHMPPCMPILLLPLSLSLSLCVHLCACVTAHRWSV